MKVCVLRHANRGFHPIERFTTAVVDRCELLDVADCPSLVPGPRCPKVERCVCICCACSFKMAFCCGVCSR